MLPPSLPETLCREFSLSEIISATDNFSRDLIIGKGSFGNVYKGTIVLTPGNKTIVAVKRRSSDSKQDANEMLLVYEYMPNGTLADHIYKKNEKSVLLSWEQRLKICISVGRGLDYLHTGTRINHIIIHRDLKSSNILLDADWAPKISDFGLCKKCSGNLLPGMRIIPLIAGIKGTRGYMDPHYCKTHELSTNTDVYAFGVVFLEVLCGRRSLDFEAAEREKRLVLWAKQCMREGVAHRLVDPGLWGSLTDVGLHVFLDITLKCLQDQLKKRPTLAEVVGKLEIALASQFATTYSSSSSVDSEIFKHFNQGFVVVVLSVAYSSTSASSNVDASR
ncbi:receptor-like protein kinase FERONIA [Bidens hawaiensis]|uniref:receptor-like protein kinase FERONIA n=1 Tax=Bidens hawaiensis TaxID=980011 RepID=UPI004049F9CD